MALATRGDCAWLCDASKPSKSSDGLQRERGRDAAVGTLYQVAWAAAVMGAVREDLFANFSETAGGREGSDCKMIAVRPQVLWAAN